VINDYEKQTRETLEDRKSALRGTIAALILFLPANAWNAFIVYKLYGWFAVPVGAPILSWLNVWGLVLLFEILTLKTSSGTTEVLPRLGKALTTLVVGTVTVSIMFLVGLLIHGLMVIL